MVLNQSEHCRDEQVLEIRDLEELKLIQSCSMAPHYPDGLATPSEGVLFYADVSVKPSRIKRLELTSDLVSLDSGSIINLPQTNIAHNVCFAQYALKHVVVVTCGVPYSSHGGIFGYNVKTKKLEWQVEGKLAGMTESLKAQGITADDDGHLFASDDNNSCIQMFDIDGQYLGAVLKKGDHGLSDPHALTWCKGLSSLVVVHGRGARFISVIKVQTVNS